MKKIETITKGQLKKYRDMGFTSKEIAEMFNCSKHTINNRIKDFGLQQSKEKDFCFEKMKELVREGYKVKEIAKLMNITYTTARYRVQQITGISEKEEETLKKLFGDMKKIRVRLKYGQDLEFFENLELKRILKITMLEQDCCYELELIN